MVIIRAKDYKYNLCYEFVDGEGDYRWHVRQWAGQGFTIEESPEYKTHFECFTWIAD